MEWPERKAGRQINQAPAEFQRLWSEQSPIRAYDEVTGTLWAYRIYDNIGGQFPQIGPPKTPEREGHALMIADDKERCHIHQLSNALSLYKVEIENAQASLGFNIPPGFQKVLGIPEKVQLSVSTNFRFHQLSDSDNFPVQRSEMGLFYWFTMLLHHVGYPMTFDINNLPALVEQNVKDSELFLREVRKAIWENSPGTREMVTPKFMDVLEKYKLKKHRDKLVKLVRPGLAIKQKRWGLGRSQIGGRPLMNKGEKWPKHGDYYYSFVAQIDLSELPEVPGIPFPKKGLLSFFAGRAQISSNPGGMVLYQKGPYYRSQARPFSFQFMDRHNGKLYRKRKVVFEPFTRMYNASPYDLELLGIDEDLDDNIYHANEELAGVDDFSCFMGGTVHATFDRITFAANGFRFPGYSTNTELMNFPKERTTARRWQKENLTEFARFYHQWIVLLTVGSRGPQGFDWGDHNRITYLIHYDDLKEERFDKVRIAIGDAFY